MNQFKRTQVIMLPTDKILKKHFHFNEENVAILCDKNSIALTNRDNTATINHLYILSNDEIKEGDWCLNISKNIIYQKDKIPMDIMWKKIIATTDTSLIIGYTVDFNSKEIYLPQPSQQFITKYIESYNKGEVITDVLVEYESVKSGYKDEYHNYPIGKIEVPIYKEQLKVNFKDNTITIKKVKDSWNREEVIELLKQCYADQKAKYGIDKWIEENL